MTDLEKINQPYLFKLKKSKNVINLIYKHHGIGRWTKIHDGWEAKEDRLTLQGWETDRRVIIVRKRISGQSIIGIESEKDEQQLSLIDGPEDLKVYEYSVLVTDLECDLISAFHHYRDRADCENNFDELKNQWGWGGFTTREAKSCRLMSRMIALIYNWWNLYVRLSFPDQHHEAITSRPLLLTSIGRLTNHSGQKKITITSTHGRVNKLASAFTRLSSIFNTVKEIAPQLTLRECWDKLLAYIIAQFEENEASENPPDTPVLT